MSGLALPALGLAQRAVQALPALFADLSLRSPAGEIVLLESSGYAAAGKGAARYIADDLCDAALLDAHPRFVFAAANGRIFRLFPEAGSLSAEQGGALGDALSNDQPAIQAAIDYAEAIGARELRFESAHYRIHCPVRTSPAADTRAEDGHPLVVRRTLALRGCAPDRSVLDFRGVGGADPDSNWQTVARSVADSAPAVWRGGGLYVQGDTPRPTTQPRRIARLTLDRLVLQGNRTRTGVATWPADPVTGDGWDISDKAFWSQDCYLGEIHCTDTDMIGWRGEIFYLAGAVDAVRRLSVTRCRFLTTNGNAFNPGVDCDLVARDCEFGDCFQAQEETGKTSAVYRNCLWRDCETLGLGSGPAGGYLYNIAFPTRDEAAAPPATVLDGCRFHSAGLLSIASWVRGHIVTVDTRVHMTGNAAMALRDVDLKIDAWIDRRPSFQALTFYGVYTLTEAVPGAPADTHKQPPTQVRITLRHFRTALAETLGNEWLGIVWAGYIARNCRIAVSGDYASARTPNGGDNPLSMPFVAFTGGTATTAYTPQGIYKGASLSASGVLAPAGPLMALAVTGESALALTLPAYPAGGAAYGYADRQQVRLVKQLDQGSVTFTKGAAPSMAMMATRTLDHRDDWIEFTYNRSRARWEESGFFSTA
ncbi:hypothetical protein [Qipengyuania marisflavi]|uniref:Right-handed parallel beta-helix repeat-containing protein n=1 Tax=Qipengyuania marisflavi TaxID=2486356 RepID=A0A5S3PBI0_9SPHN|nr:hypothetical protein [Qipengyuania marisflavi]TMM48408.1 hypothetical protein FEV51_09045 [Qipengyuania marisflavi]